MECLEQRACFRTEFSLIDRLLCELVHNIDKLFYNLRMTQVYHELVLKQRASQNEENVDVITSRESDIESILTDLAAACGTLIA